MTDFVKTFAEILGLVVANIAIIAGWIWYLRQFGN